MLAPVTTGTNEAVGKSAAEFASASGDCALPVGTRLGEFQMERVLGAGGFGIVYLALDHSLMRHVAIKEYVPSTLVERADGPMLTLRSEADAETFAGGLRSFMNEARLLASFDHPSLVKVHRFWEENGTAYMAMPYYDGCTLKDVRRGMDRAPDEAWLQGFIQPLLGALDVLHGHQVPPGLTLGFLGAVIELIAGLLIFLGLFTRVAAFIASGEMAVAYFMVHAKGGFFPIVNEGERAVIYCFVALYIACRGAGRFGIDRS